MMIKDLITISQLKAHLSAVLSRVRNGTSVTVLDRKEPIAIISTFNPPSLNVLSAPSKNFRMPKLHRASCEIDPVSILLEDRAKR